MLFKATLLAAAATIASTANVNYPPELYAFVGAQANATLAQVPAENAYPANGSPGKYGWGTSNYGGWTSGFFPGLLFKLYNYSSNVAPSPAASYWLDRAIKRTSALAPEQYDDSTHDVGFIVYTSFGAQYHLTGNTTARDITIQTAHTLCTRYSPIVGCIQSWGTHPPPNHEFEVIADNMMNLELLWWAGTYTGNQTMLDIANSHSQHMIRDLFQPFAPGCVWHLITYNDTDGSILNRSSTPQGLGLDTVWSRGQSWIVNGFTIAYRFTQNPAYLQAAQDAADCFIRLTTLCCGNDLYNWIPLWDFNVTAPQISIDTSAALIAANGMIELSWYVTDSGAKAKYLAFAKTILDSVNTNYMFTADQNDAVVMNGTVTYPTAGISIIYADYYFLDSLMRWDATPQESKEAALALLPLQKSAL